MRHLSTALCAFFLSTFCAQQATADPKLIELKSETPIEGIGRFSAGQAFTPGSRIGGRVLRLVSLNFAQHFLGVEESNVPPTSLAAWDLRYTMSDKSLLKALGHAPQAALPFLAYVHRVMDMGEKGPSHGTWRSNFAFVRSPVDQRLWAVHWTLSDADEWSIGAVHVPHTHLDWVAGSRVFASRVGALSSDPEDRLLSESAAAASR